MFGVLPIASTQKKSPKSIENNGNVGICMCETVHSEQWLVLLWFKVAKDYLGKMCVWLLRLTMIDIPKLVALPFFMVY